MSFLKLLNGELNKILMRPILYIFTGVLVLSIFLSFILFAPTPRNYDSLSDYNNCSTITDVYNTFISTTTKHGKVAANQEVSQSSSIINIAKSNNEESELTTLKNYVTDLKAKNTTYNTWDIPSKEAHVVNDIAPPEEKNDYENLKNAITTLQTNYKAYLIKNFSPLLLTKELNNKIADLFSDGLKAFDINVSSHRAHKELRQKLVELNFEKNIESFINTIKTKLISEQQITKLETFVTKSQTFLNEIETSINTLASEADPDKKEELKNLAIKYYLVADNLCSLTNNVVLYAPVLNKSDKEINSFYGYKDVYSYQIKETITKQTYLINHNNVSLDFANVFSTSQTSNPTKNAFDLVYFGLQITSFVIIIFTVVLAAGMLAGEQSSGTLKLLLIRPYSRSKILTSKLLATLIFASIFLIFSTIVFFLIGLFTMGANFTPILAVFNSSSAFVISPFLLLLIYLITLIIKVGIYILIALAISAIFRSNVGAVGVSIVLYFLLSILGAMLAGSLWYGFLPFSNFDLFKFFGGAFISGGNATPLSVIFSSTIFHGTGFLYSIIADIVIAGLICSMSYLIFKKREIK